MTHLEYFRDHVIPDWDLSPDEVTQMLGLHTGETLASLASPDPGAVQDRLAALSHLHADLRLFADDPTFAKRWLRGPNTAALFAGHSPLDVLRREDPAVCAKVASYVRGALGYDYS